MEVVGTACCSSSSFVLSFWHYCQDLANIRKGLCICKGSHPRLIAHRSNFSHQPTIANFCHFQLIFSRGNRDCDKPNVSWTFSTAFLWEDYCAVKELLNCLGKCLKHLQLHYLLIACSMCNIHIAIDKDQKTVEFWRYSSYHFRGWWQAAFWPLWHLVFVILTLDSSQQLAEQLFHCQCQSGSKYSAFVP